MSPKAVSPLEQPRPRVAVEVAKPASVIVVPGERPVTAALRRLADKGRLALGLAGEDKDRLIVARATPVAGDDDKYNVRFLIRRPGAGEDGKARVDGEAAYECLLNGTPRAGVDSKEVRVDGEAAYECFLNGTPRAGVDSKEARVGLRVIPTAAAGGSANLAWTLGRLLSAGEEAGVGLRVMLGLLRPTAAAGEAPKLPWTPARLVSAGEKPIAGEERRFSTTIAGEEGRVALVARLPGALGLRSGACRLVSLGGVLGRRFHSTSAAVDLTGSVAQELSKRVAVVEETADVLVYETIKIEKRVSVVEQKVTKLRRGLFWVQTTGLGIGTVVVLGCSTIWYNWDAKKLREKVREFMLEQASTAASEYGTGIWNDAKKFLSETFNMSNTSNALSKWTGGWLGSSFEEQAKAQEYRLAEEARWINFLRSRPPHEGYTMSCRVYWFKEMDRKAVAWREHKEKMERLHATGNEADGKKEEGEKEEGEKGGEAGQNDKRP